ncbi:Mitogen-activated protein kinase kinase kinase ANP1 [Bienertia sinuspersici]
MKSSNNGKNGWVKGKMIGSGSYGAVHIAMNKESGRLFVVKSSKTEVGWKSLENEAKILMNLKKSRHVVKCLGKEVTHDKNGEWMYNIFLEHIGGGSISDIVDQFGGTLCEVVVRSYTKQILKSLQYLHDKGIVHCDIKCKNVLLDSHGNVKLADFGCAQSFHKKDEYVGALVGGTPLWMAPEVLRGEGLDDAAADIWSLGCTVIEMATGKLPWGQDINPMSSIYKIAKTKHKPQLPHKFSAHGLDFLHKCLQRNPKKRWTAQQLLHHPFVLETESQSQSVDIEEDYQNITLFSPASVLDVRKFDHISDCEDETSPSSLSGRGLASMSRQLETNELDDSFLGCRKPDLETSTNWIVVRST